MMADSMASLDIVVALIVGRSAGAGVHNAV